VPGARRLTRQGAMGDAADGPSTARPYPCEGPAGRARVAILRAISATMGTSADHDLVPPGFVGGLSHIPPRRVDCSEAGGPDTPPHLTPFRQPGAHFSFKRVSRSSRELIRPLKMSPPSPPVDSTNDLSAVAGTLHDRLDRHRSLHQARTAALVSASTHNLHTVGARHRSEASGRLHWEPST
jgi:hypothetical protein